MESSGVRIRLACREDIVDLIAMIEELAVFERIYGEPKLTVEDMVQACAFDNPTILPDIVVLVAEDTKSENAANSSLVGYTILLPGYSARSGQILLMKNMYVRESHRSAGVGRALFVAIAAYARQFGYAYEENHVLNWNTPAVNYYRRMGAEDLTTSEHWRYYRVPLTPAEEKIDVN